MKMARGTLYLMIAEVMFVLSGWAIHIVAGRILGKNFYGVFVLLLTLLTQYRIFLASGVHRAVAKYISEDPRFAPAVRRQALRLQFIAGWALCGLVWVIAPSLARLWQNAELVGYIRLTGFFFPIFGLYSVYRGVLNGMKLFGREALVSIVYSLLKVLFLFVLIHYYGIAGGRNRISGRDRRGDVSGALSRPVRVRGDGGSFSDNANCQVCRPGDALLLHYQPDPEYRPLLHPGPDSPSRH